MKKTRTEDVPRQDRTDDQVRRSPLPTPYPGYSMIRDVNRDRARVPPIGQKKVANEPVSYLPEPRPTRMNPA